jgi:hypothetical protein
VVPSCSTRRYWCWHDVRLARRRRDRPRRGRPAAGAIVGPPSDWPRAARVVRVQPQVAVARDSRRLPQGRGGSDPRHAPSRGVLPRREAAPASPLASSSPGARLRSRTSWIGRSAASSHSAPPDWRSAPELADGPNEPNDGELGQRHLGRVCLALPRNRLRHDAVWVSDIRAAVVLGIGVERFDRESRNPRHLEDVAVMVRGFPFEPPGSKSSSRLDLAAEASRSDSTSMGRRRISGIRSMHAPVYGSRLYLSVHMEERPAGCGSWADAPRRDWWGV